MKKIQWKDLIHEVIQLLGVAQLVAPNLTGLPSWVGGLVAAIATFTKNIDTLIPDTPVATTPTTPPKS